MTGFKGEIRFKLVIVSVEADEQEAEGETIVVVLLMFEDRLRILEDKNVWEITSLLEALREASMYEEPPVNSVFFFIS